MNNILSSIEFGFTKKLPVIIQTEVAECGLTSIAMVLSYHGHKVSLNKLRQQHSISQHGITLLGLMELAESLELSARPVKLELESIGNLTCPCILHWNMDHFVVLRKVTRKGLEIHDPSSGAKFISFDKANELFTGIALELQPTQRFEKKTEIPKISISSLWSNIIGLKRSLINILFLSFIIQVFSLALPFYSQLIFDDVLVNSDYGLLTVLAFGFLVIQVLKAATTFIRSYAALHLGSLLNFQMSLNIFRHLIRLPADYFSKRHIGDILSRFNSAHQIRQMMTDGVVTVLVDGIMAISTLIFMAVYSTTLTLVTVLTLFIYLIIRIVFYQLTRNRIEESIIAKAEENSTFLETLRAIKGIKTFGKERDRTNVWQNKLASVINTDIKVSKLNIHFGFSHELLFGIETVVVMFIGANLILDGQFSVGMLIAFIAYKGNFLQRGYALIEIYLEFKMLSLYMERLSDIVLLPKEDVGLLNPITELKGGIECENVCFKYAENDKLVLDKVNFKIEPGESVAIVGPSGGGKSTLLHLLVGLYQPTSGIIKVDGKKLNEIGIANFRKCIAVVHQNDQLLSGTIEENICFFDSQPDREFMKHCAYLAGIAEDIHNMPMRFRTLIGDMGSALSGGQIQRVMLARALYRKPKIIMLDEATSHLDLINESVVNQSIRDLKITRIIIAHRKETITSADRIISLVHGKVVDS
ncbi:peptidase domain-containing ABC transporter [Flavobacterium sp. W21_SRS_FM6]|uniref:peptidase domain-containing ABC transporter n=1 Tax=Flavobacterium sp. W21_SRS_FM6 TaxID=3240268 RepID=UPI003F91DED0